MQTLVMSIIIGKDDLGRELKKKKEFSHNLISKKQLVFLLRSSQR